MQCLFKLNPQLSPKIQVFIYCIHSRITHPPPPPLIRSPVVWFPAIQREITWNTSALYNVLAWCVTFSIMAHAPGISTLHPTYPVPGDLVPPLSSEKSHGTEVHCTMRLHGVLLSLIRDGIPRNTDVYG